MKTSVTLVALSCLLIAGCVAIYQPPNDRPTSKIRITTNTDDNTSVFITDTKGCDSGLAFMGPQILSHEDNLAPIVIGQSSQPSKRTRERTIEANDRVELTVLLGTGAGYSCEMGATFVPRDTSQYELELSIDKSARKCYARVYELRADIAGKALRVIESSATYFHPGQLKCAYR